MNPHEPWSAAEVDRLLELKTAGLRNGDIALALGRTYFSVTHKLNCVRRERSRTKPMGGDQ